MFTIENYAIAFGYFHLEEKKKKKKSLNCKMKVSFLWKIFVQKKKKKRNLLEHWDDTFDDIYKHFE